MADHDTTEVDVVIVGAGISGLATADELTRAGARVAVLEARPRIGGRLLGAPLDLGATWFWEGEERVKALADRLGLAVFPQHLAGDTLVEDQLGVHRYTGNLIDGPSFRYTEGAAALAEGLAAGLPEGTIVLDRPVDAITAGDLLTVNTRTHTWQARHVVLGVPPAVAVSTIALPPELPAETIHIAASTPVWMGQVVKVVAVYDEPFWRHEGLAGAAASRLGPLQEIHDMSGPDGAPAALFGFAPADRIGGDAHQQVRRQLERMFGSRAADPRELVIHNWSTEHWTHPAPHATLTDYALFGNPHYQHPALGGRLHWTSTETATTFAGHVEGALEAAERTAAAIEAALQPSTLTT